MRNKGRRVAIKAFLFMAVHVEHTNCSINFHIGRQKMADTIPKMNEILAHNVIYEHCPLWWMNVGGYEGSEMAKVGIPLLFSPIHVHDAVWSKTAVPSTCNGDDSCSIASLGRLHSLFNDSEIVITWRFLWIIIFTKLIYIESRHTVRIFFAVFRKSLYSSRRGIIPPPSENQTLSSSFFCFMWSALKLPSATNTRRYTHLGSSTDYTALKEC